MTSTDAPDPHGVTAGINRIEGYLLWQAETAGAEERAEAFCDRLPWLTTGQREEVERVYVQDRLDDARRDLRRVAARCEELQEEYRARYRTLRRRLVAACLLAGCGLAFVTLLALGLRGAPAG
ncbi:hypothetical protein ACFYYR_23305 [Streptomyces sp. NPDC001922]|uniref:hypothetical protein n=1 Tax=Streptomyces sp. NPDC001922 TaxID=3364624 RepID=UPI0036CD17DB